jgi:hypothetical protein
VDIRWAALGEGAGGAGAIQKEATEGAGGTGSKEAGAVGAIQEATEAKKDKTINLLRA